MNSYNTRFSVRRRLNTRDARGELSSTYAHQRYIWAETPRDGSVRLVNGAGVLLSEGTLRSRTPYITDVLIGDQLVDSQGHEYYVRSATDADGRRIETQFVLAQQPSVI